MRWVRPDLTTSVNSSDLARSPAARWSSPASVTSVAVRAQAMCTADGNESLDDWEALTWSLGCTTSLSSPSPSSCLARLATTSLTFMLVDVPDPVWKVSTGKCSSRSPAMTSSAARRMASATVASTTPSSSLAVAAAHLIMAWACTTAAGTGMPETGKFSTARWVEAPHSASAGICISPIVSWAVRVSVMGGSWTAGWMGAGMPAPARVRS